MGSTLRRWRRSFFSKPKTVDIDSIVVNVYGGCMGLPQEVVERVMRMLQDNRRALKACSLTCKAMFASTRHLIHQTLHLTTGNNQKVLTLRERKQHPQKDHPELALRLLPLMAERGLLRYARHLNIDLRCDFSPPLLGPHLQHLQSLDRIHTLTVHWCNPFVSRVIYDSSFSNFYPTLTTLVLHSSIHDDHRYVPHFIRQFPNLQNLTFRSLRSPPLDWTAFREPLVVSQAPPPPPLRGHLRCINVTPGTPLWPKSFPSDLPCSLNFRSVEFQNVHCSNGQQILDLCAGTLEEFTICIDRKGHGELGHLRFQKNASLRYLTIRTPFSNLPNLNLRPSCERLSNDLSLSLSELVFELTGLPSGLNQPSQILWGNWDAVDKRFEHFLRLRPEFKIVIRTGRLYNRDEFQAQARERFPSMAGRDRLEFETCLTVDR